MVVELMIGIHDANFWGIFFGLQDMVIFQDQTLRLLGDLNQRMVYVKVLFDPYPSEKPWSPFRSKGTKECHQLHYLIKREVPLL